MSPAVKLSISIGLLLLLAASLTSAGSARPRAKLALVDTQPLVVAGRGFAPAERVTLRTALNGRQITKKVTASRIGRFTVRLAATNADCDPFTVSAAGRAGSRAMLRRINIPPPCGIVITP